MSIQCQTFLGHQLLVYGRTRSRLRDRGIYSSPQTLYPLKMLSYLYQKLKSYPIFCFIIPLKGGTNYPIWGNIIKQMAKIQSPAFQTKLVSENRLKTVINTFQVSLFCVCFKLFSIFKENNLQPLSRNPRVKVKDS